MEKTELGRSYLPVCPFVHPSLHSGIQSFSTYLVSTYYVRGIMEGSGHKVPAFPILLLVPQPPRFLLRSGGRNTGLAIKVGLRPTGGCSVPWLD